MPPPGQEVICASCGAHLNVDLDFCLECGADRRAQPTGQAPSAPASGPAPVHPAPRAEAPPQPVMPVVANRGRISLGLVLGVIGLILAVVGIASLSWFMIEEQEADTTMRLGLKEIEMKYGSSEQKESYKTLENQLGGDLKSDDVAGTTWWLLVIGLTLAGLFLLFAFLALIGVFRGSITWLPVVFGLVAGILVVVGAAYFGISFQSALEEDMDEKLADQEGTDYGLGAAFYMAIVGGVLILLGALFTKAQTSPSGQIYPMRQG